MSKDAGSQGHEAQSPWQMPLSAWKDVAVRTWRESSDDNVGLVAAGVAFYAFLGLVPTLGAIVLIYGLVAEPQTVIENMQTLTALLPRNVAELIAQQLLNVVQTSSDKKGIGLVVALAIALWGARNAAGAIITALNIAYEEEEKRGFLKVTLMALGMTAAAVLMAILAMLAMTALGYLTSLFPNLPPFVATLGKIVSYLVLVLVAAAAVATLYRYGPSRDQAKWVWLTPGSLLAAIGWVILTLGFGFYVANFGNYNATYGSLGAVVVLLTWVYLSGYVLLFAAELNSELEHQTAADTTKGASEPLGTRGAWAADHVAGEGPSGNPQAPKGPSEEGASKQPGRSAVQPSGAPQPSLAQHPDDRPSPVRGYVAARATATAGRAAGIPKVGMLASILSTAGLGMLRRKGGELAGAVLLGSAAALALLRRKEA